VTVVLEDAESKPETFTRSTLVALLKAVHAVHETAKRGGFRKEVATMERWKENFQDIAAFFLASPDGKAVREFRLVSLGIFVKSMIDRKVFRRSWRQP
jgi:hypothetical protein